MAFIKAKKTAWNTERGMALLYEDDPKNGVIIPIDALPPLGAHARRVIAGVQASKGRTTKTYDWRYAHPLKEDAFAVETMRADTGDTIVLVIDPTTRSAPCGAQGKDDRPAFVHHRPQQAQLATSLFLSSKLDAFASLRRGGVAVKPCKGFGTYRRRGAAFVLSL